MYLASWKRKGWARPEPDYLARGISILAHGTTVRVDTLEQTHGLKKSKPARLVKKLLR
jgi:hypothetical protein